MASDLITEVDLITLSTAPGTRHHLPIHNRDSDC